MSFADSTRLLSFFGVFLACAALETFSRRKELSAPRPLRWASNLGILVLDILAVRLLIPLAASDVAEMAARRGWGLLNQVSWPFQAKILTAFLFLDLVIYCQHRIFHKTPWLWRLHKVHHTDMDLDVTTGVRFHPLEMLISMIIKIAAVAAIGAPVFAVLAFEIVLNATSLFNHSNIRIPESLDRLLRLIVVTPDMHQVHHSVIVEETNSNFSFNFPWWDRVLGTYRSRPVDGRLGMTIGLPEHQEPRLQTLPWLLSLPFNKNP